MVIVELNCNGLDFQFDTFRVIGKGKTSIIVIKTFDKIRYNRSYEEAAPSVLTGQSLNRSKAAKPTTHSLRPA